MADVQLEEDLSQTAFDMIEEHGTAVELHYPATGRTMNTATGKFINAVGEADKTVNAIVEHKGLWVNAETGRVGEIKLTIAGKSVTRAVEPGVAFTHGGEKYTIFDKGVVRYIYGDSVVIFEAYGKRGR